MHCSRPGKGNETDDASLFSDDLKNAMKTCEPGQGDFSSQLIWPAHINTFSAIGITLELSSLNSITSTLPKDSGTSVCCNGMRKGDGVSFSAEAVKDAFANSTDYNEWTTANAKAIGIFVNDHEPLEVAQRVSVKDVPGYDPTMAHLFDNPEIIGAVPISISEFHAKFPSPPIYRHQNGEIIQIDISSISICS